MTGDGHFGHQEAVRYDKDHGGADPTQTVDVLADLAAGQCALEFAIGTGRVALPLAARGVDVEGIELSSAMVAELRKKPGGAELRVEIGDMSLTKMGAGYSLVFLVFNTINNLTTQDAQIACFQNAADHLLTGGRFVVEVQVPPLQRLPFGEKRLTFASDDSHWGVDEIDVVTQQFWSHHVWFDGKAARKLSVPFRYTWPSELDLMARMAGLTLESRWAGWDRAPFTATSSAHVSVWRKLS